MKLKLEEILPDHVLVETDSPNIYIVDYKDINGGDVELLVTQPTDVKFVYLDNFKPISIFFDGFRDNALPIDVGHYCRQCECVLFPKACNDNDWILFIETKYANDRKAAFNEVRDYPNSMIDQIIKTVTYFREKGIIDNKRRINAIVSFPNLIEEFNSTFFKDDFTEIDILREYNILIRATNSALIKSEKRIVLNSM